MSVPGKVLSAPLRGREGERGYGFTVGQRVVVTSDGFHGRHGYVRCFQSNGVVRVDFETPPTDGRVHNGNWFNYADLRPAPEM